MTAEFRSTPLFRCFVPRSGARPPSAHEDGSTLERFSLGSLDLIESADQWSLQELHALQMTAFTLVSVLCEQICVATCTQQSLWINPGLTRPTHHLSWSQLCSSKSCQTPCGPTPAPHGWMRLCYSIFHLSLTENRGQGKETFCLPDQKASLKPRK